MRCPACDGTLAQHVERGIALDVCERSCGGVWFDAFELSKFDKPSEPVSRALLDSVSRKSATNRKDGQRRCPKCPNTILHRFFSSVRRHVQIDECPECAGVWLDAGELAAIRREFMSEQQKDAAADKQFDRLFGAELRAEIARDKAAEQRAKKIAHALRFICLSYWLPGKQPGASF